MYDIPFTNHLRYKTTFVMISMLVGEWNFKTFQDKASTNLYKYVTCKNLQLTDIKTTLKKLKLAKMWRVYTLVPSTEQRVASVLNMNLILWWVKTN